MRPGARSRIMAATLLGAGVACGDGGTEPLRACSEPIQVSVSAGTSPTISWTPACGVGYLTVRRPLPPSTGGGVDPQWTIRSDGQRIGSSVRYGVRPPGTVEVVAPQPLLAGQSYGVVLGHSDESFLGSFIFTP
jgi:hypothetical protein